MKKKLVLEILMTMTVSSVFAAANTLLTVIVIRISSTSFFFIYNTSNGL